MLQHTKKKEYRKKLMKEDIENHLLKAEDDIRNGRVRNARDVFKVCTNWKKNRTERKYRRMVINNYVILYTIDKAEKNVYVAHIYYGGRNYIDNLI